MNVLEIVTDASMYRYNNGRVFGCAGAICIGNGISRYLVCQDSTNNRAELLGVYLGIVLANDLSKANPGFYDEIIIYSDSKLSVYGLTHWMKDWIRNRDRFGVMYGSNNKPVKNQELFAMILSYLVNNNLKIKFRHCAGHIAPTSVKLVQANEIFNESNGYYLRPEEVYKISYYNNIVDNATRDRLHYINPDDYPIVPRQNVRDIMCKVKIPSNYKKYVG